MSKPLILFIASFLFLGLYLGLAFVMPVASAPIVWLIGDKLDWESRRLALLVPAMGSFTIWDFWAEAPMGV